MPPCGSQMKTPIKFYAFEEPIFSRSNENNFNLTEDNRIDLLNSIL